jgi:hypothetical protein
MICRTAARSSGSNERVFCFLVKKYIGDLHGP